MLQLSFLLSLTHPLAVITSEFNYFFWWREKISIGRTLRDVRHAKLFFLLLSTNEWIAWNFTHTSSLKLIDVADSLKWLLGNDFRKGKLKDIRTSLGGCVTGKMNLACGIFFVFISFLNTVTRTFTIISIFHMKCT